MRLSLARDLSDDMMQGDTDIILVLSMSDDNDGVIAVTMIRVSCDHVSHPPDSECYPLPSSFSFE